jgi:hypothetical protein
MLAVIGAVLAVPLMPSVPKSFLVMTFLGAAIVSKQQKRPDRTGEPPSYVHEVENATKSR